ncbi:WPP domain-interacting tail-anchored protein 1 [Forsythia ovata]|uniref:RING-type E3 ubiquitin transferase n=1 Tax=Forsythia ovata TaxID=205694 RepID=A0ABD1WR59_9LAMI
MGVNADTVKDGSTSIEIVNASEMESESNNIDSLEVISSSGDITQQIRSAAEILTTVELDLACSSEKLVNLDLLVMYLEAREYDFEAFVLDEDSTPEGSDEKALEFDLLSGILDSEVKELGNFLSSLHTELLSSQGVISSFEQFGEAFKGMEEKLNDCEECLKQSFERVTEIQAQSSSFQRILLTSARDENWKDNKEVLSFENGDLLRQNTKIKTQTVEQQRKILRMLERSLARELDLEKKLNEFRQTEEDLNITLQQEVYCMEEEVQVTWERLFEAENAAEILLGISKVLLGQAQILQFKLNGSIQREGELRSKVQDLVEQLKDKDRAFQNSESTRLELVEKVNSLEQQLKDSSDKNEDLSSKIHETENIINQLKEKTYEAEQMSESAEAECNLLREFNVELNKDLCILKSSITSSDERVKELERKLKDSEIKRQHAVAFAEASQEKQIMLDCTIKDMENLIENLKLRVSKAESHTESAEEKCIILSESNTDLSERINFLTGRTEDLEASLHQAEEAKRETAKDIGIRTKFITDLIVQLALERERLHEQVLSLVNGKKIAVKHLREVYEDPTVTTTVNSKGNTKESVLSENDSRNATSAEESNEETTESLATSHETSNKLGDVHTSERKMERADPTSKLATVRDISPNVVYLHFDFGLSNAEPESWGCEYADSLPDRNCSFCREEYDEPMNFVTDLFESRDAHVLDDPIWEFDSGPAEDPGLEFGFGPGLGLDTVPSAFGVQVVGGANLESDSGEFEVNSGFIVNDEDNYDSFGVNDYRINENERFEWEEVNERNQFDDRENLDSNPEEINSGSEDLPDDYILTMEQLVENENAVKFGLPASKSVVENLPSIVLTVDEVRDNNDAVVCAVCKEDVLAGEKMTRMPCFHLYHGDCIFPWLEIRNTCPVCRYELPTDDADYENRRSHRGGDGVADRLADGIQV